MGILFDVRVRPSVYGEHVPTSATSAFSIWLLYRDGFCELLHVCKPQASNERCEYSAPFHVRN